ncbi:MAG TPA: FAD-dependent oxidoreductase [Kofleriaceae bacterium]|nr:FAD-dependent oxidoreductase [Kofleriaceae bacterium]
MAELDVVIIGGGVSGLCAAHDLRDRRILVLEKEPRPGGRVLTRQHGDVAYDLGALFAYPERQLRVPAPPSQPVAARGPIGLWHAGRLHLGANVVECIRGTDLPPHDVDALLELRQTGDTAKLSPAALALADAFFHVTYPGALEEYIPERRRDALKTLAPHFHDRGNGALVRSLCAELGDRLVVGAGVRAVDDRGDHVHVAYEVAGEPRAVQARAALVSTPATLTRALLTRMTPEARYFLDSVAYRSGLVVVLFCPRHAVSAFSYLVTVGAQLNTVIRQDKGEVCVLTCYYVGAAARELAGAPHARIVEQTVRDVIALGIATLAPDDVTFADVQFWPIIGPIISERMRAYHRPCALRPSERVVLAGEYTQATSLPYGMMPAMASGHRAAAEVRALLEPARPTAAPTGLDDLVISYRYVLHDAQPAFLEHKTEGNIAFHGLVLQAAPDPALRDDLLARRRDGLWEYHQGYGITTEDSTLVIEGLWAAGTPREVLLPSLQALVDRCFDDAAGAFHTIPRDRQGRAAYWQGPSIDATAHAGYLLHAIAPEPFATQIERCADFLCAHQAADGRFTGRWFPAWTWTTYHAVRLLHATARTAAAERARWALLRDQADDGSWQRAVIHTAAAVLALGVLDAGDPAIARGRAWLRGQERRDGWPPEAVLYYWFDGHARSAGWYDGPAARRVFFHAMDRGRITTAWARLALKGADHA